VCSQELPHSCKRARPPTNGNTAHIYMQLLEARPAKDNLHLGRYCVLHCLLYVVAMSLVCCCIVCCMLLRCLLYVVAEM